MWKIVLGNCDDGQIILAGFHCPFLLCSFVVDKIYEDVHYQYHASTIPLSFCLFRLLLRTFLF